MRMMRELQEARDAARAAPRKGPRLMKELQEARDASRLAVKTGPVPPEQQVEEAQGLTDWAQSHAYSTLSFDVVVMMAMMH